MVDLVGAHLIAAAETETHDLEKCMTPRVASADAIVRCHFAPVVISQFCAVAVMKSRIHAMRVDRVRDLHEVGGTIAGLTEHQHVLRLRIKALCSSCAVLTH